MATRATSTCRKHTVARTGALSTLLQKRKSDEKEVLPEYVWENRVRDATRSDTVHMLGLLDDKTVSILCDLVAVMRHRHSNKWAGEEERRVLKALDTYTKKRKIK